MLTANRGSKTFSTVYILFVAIPIILTGTVYILGRFHLTLFIFMVDLKTWSWIGIWLLFLVGLVGGWIHFRNNRNPPTQGHHPALVAPPTEVISETVESRGDEQASSEEVSGCDGETSSGDEAECDATRSPHPRVEPPIQDMDHRSVQGAECPGKIHDLRLQVSRLEKDKCRLRMENDERCRELVRSRPRVWQIARYRFVENEKTRGRRETCVEQPAMNDRVLYFKYKGKRTEHRFARVFGPACPDCEIWLDAQHTVLAALCARPAAIVAEGYSGTGKTHTMFSGVHAIADHVAFRLAAWIESGHEEGHESAIRCAITEVYQEKAYDLLDKRQEVKVEAVGDQVLPLKCFRSIGSHTRLMRYFSEAQRMRRSAPTADNPRSSLGHMVATICLSRQSTSDSRWDESTIYLVDLSAAMQAPLWTQGPMTKDSGRLHFHKLLAKMYEGKDCRGEAGETTLTKVLRNLFQRQSRVGLITHLSSATAHQTETFDTLQFVTEVIDGSCVLV